VFVSVKTPNGGTRGLAKLIGRVGECASVEFFDAPTLRPRTEEIDAGLVEPITLPEQTRLYHFNERLQAWRIGRLVDDHGDSQLIKFPNGQSAILPVTDVFVRCAAPIADPTPFLAAQITETPRFADARSEFVRSVIAQRGACMGMSALLSSAIELEAHQVEGVRRVLQDPIQRSLLRGF
jgi:ATP-dependent helicase HepA